MHIHILGICGTFMGGLAIIARQMGHRVSGSDANVYPPMSDQLADSGIELIEGWDPAQLSPEPDLVVIGNALSRGNPCVEHVLERGLRYTSGPQFLGENLLAGRWVLAVAGTHGKTSTSSMLAWILEAEGFDPGFLIGGVPGNFGCSARLTDSAFFVVEADEYDSAFFDKRSKFVHYHPRTLVLNNLEFDHADIFEDLAAIERQFHHLVRTLPGSARILLPVADDNLQRVLARGVWSEVQTLGPTGSGARWVAEALRDDCSEFRVSETVDSDTRLLGTLCWDQLGTHNMQNALAAVVAAQHVGVRPARALAALAEFKGSKRRMELLGEPRGIAIYDDFAHHPTAIATTLAGLRARIGTARRLVAVIEPRSNTMKMGVHNDALAPAVADADYVFWYRGPDVDWNLQTIADAAVATSRVHASRVYDSTEALLDALVELLEADDSVVLMSNGAFGGIHQRLLQRLGGADSSL